MRVALILRNIIKLFFRQERKFYFFLCRTAGCFPVDLSLYHEAFTHKSANKKHNGRPFNNERLEYLGDGIIDFAVAEVLYRKFPDAEEGALSRMRGDLVSRKQLNQIASALGFCDYLMHSNSQPLEKTHLPGDALEAIVAAIYLDKGMEHARHFVRMHIASDETIRQSDQEHIDYKSALIQWGQHFKTPVSFESSQPSAVAGELEFTVRAIKAETGETLGEGKGKNKKVAEQNAASDALCKLLGAPYERNFCLW